MSEFIHNNWYNIFGFTLYIFVGYMFGYYIASHFNKNKYMWAVLGAVFNVFAIAALLIPQINKKMLYEKRLFIIIVAAIFLIMILFLFFEAPT